MGCDIHVHAEVLVEGRWLHFGQPRVDRNYALFARMAGVRSYDDVDPIAQPRGIPTDATESTRYDFGSWGCDAHTPSWLGEVEIRQLWREFYEGREGRYPHLEGWFPDWFDDAGSYYPFRWVFWFDN